MLNKILKGAAAAVAALTFTAGSSAAENYRVLMMGQAFFPDVSYVQDGDTLTFVNMSGISRTISADDGSWSTPELSDGAEATISVIRGMANIFQFQLEAVDPAAATADDTTTAEETTTEAPADDIIIGKMNFSTQPTVQSN
ncbi:hypothetical protein [Sulfitobacter sp.]|uniref:hypothetical protein n=1 Tax=Sulfitobacter sp. TaxID=1903071 RepID=UPI0030014602